MTKLEVITMMMNNEMIMANADFKAYLEKEKIALENKKVSRAKAKAKKSELNTPLENAIINAMVALGRPATVTEIVEKVGMSGFTSQKCTALLKNIGATSEKVKGKSLYTLPSED